MILAALKSAIKFPCTAVEWKLAGILTHLFNDDLVRKKKDVTAVSEKITSGKETVQAF